MTCDAAHAVSSEQQVGGDRSARRDLLDQQRLEAVEARELLVDAGVGIETIDKRLDEPPPLIPLVGAHIVAVRSSVDPRERAPEIPARQDVGEGVVVDRLVVLIRSDHPVDVRRAIGLGPCARGPVAGGLDQEPLTGSTGELLVARPVEIAARRPCHLPHDVILERAGSDGDDAPRPIACRRWRDVLAGTRRLPGKPRPSATGTPRRVHRRGEAPDAVLEHGAGSRRMRRREKREHEGIRVPEDVTPIARTGQPAGTDPRLAVVARGRHEVEQREPRCPLQLVVAFDHDIGILPAPRPGATVLVQQHVESQRPDSRRAANDGCRIRRLGSIRGVAHDAVGHVRIAGSAPQTRSCCHHPTLAAGDAQPRDIALVASVDHEIWVLGRHE